MDRVSFTVLKSHFAVSSNYMVVWRSYTVISKYTEASNSQDMRDFIRNSFELLYLLLLPLIFFAVSFILRLLA